MGDRDQADIAVALPFVKISLDDQQPYSPC
jgi:hypothetical protein